MKFHIEALNKKQFAVLQHVAPIAQSQGFYLAGGTALAIYFGHRVSVDLDWFTGQEMSDAMLFAQSLRAAKLDFVTEQASAGTLHGTISNVRVTFLEYRYQLLKPAIEWKETGCVLASLEDLACMKLSAVAQRGARKDFCDIYALGKEQFSLKQMLSLYQTKFGIQDIGHVLYGLTYFDDAENERMPKMLWNVKWAEIKKTIQNWAKDVG